MHASPNNFHTPPIEVKTWKASEWLSNTRLKSSLYRSFSLLVNYLSDDVRHNVCWNVGRGPDVEFWRYPWIDGFNPPISYVSPDIANTLGRVAIADIGMVDHNGDWLWSNFQHLLPTYVLLRPAAIKGPRRDLVGDSVSVGWKGSVNHYFSCSVEGHGSVIARSRWLLSVSCNAIDSGPVQHTTVALA
ncbi:hypothetical protein V6N13_144188 [Hibiscus sabdariffa]